MVPPLISSLAEPGEPGEPARQGWVISSTYGTLLAPVANQPHLPLVLFLAGWRAGELLLQSSDSGLGDPIRWDLLVGETRPFPCSLLTSQALLEPPVLYDSRKTEFIFALAFPDIFVCRYLLPGWFCLLPNLVRPLPGPLAAATGKITPPPALCCALHFT